jgi:hypothetical protein
MSNIRKSFSFRDGVQVDQDVFVVRGLNVGIGTSVPTESFDVRGTVKVVGLVTANSLIVSGVSTFSSVKVGVVSITSGIITASSATGVVTYYGDGGRLANLPTSQWLDVDAGLGFTSIYAQGFVGVSTNDPRFAFQVGGDPNSGGKGVGISSSGNFRASGILTANSFVGFGSGITYINASNISLGTLSNDRFPTIDTNKLPSNINISGILTANSLNVETSINVNTITSRGDITGIALTSRGLIGQPSIEVWNLNVARNAEFLGITTLRHIVGTSASVGISTVSQQIHVGTGGTLFAASVTTGRIGFGTGIPGSDVQLVRPSNILVEVVGQSGQSRISIGQSVGVGNSSSVLRFGSVAKTFDILNNDSGGINCYTHAGTGPGLNTGGFKWIYGKDNSTIFSLTYDGKAAIGRDNPITNFDIVGVATITDDLFVDGDVSILGGIVAGSGINRVNFGNGEYNLLNNTNINVTTGISTIAALRVIGVGSIGIQTTTPITDFDARTSSGMFGAIGIKTERITAELTVAGSAVFTNKVGIGTTTFPLTPEDQGNLQIYRGGITINEGALLIKGTTAAIGIGTNLPLCALDLSNAKTLDGKKSVFVPPHVNQTDLASMGVYFPVGGIVYHTEKKTHYYTRGDGTQWLSITGEWRTGDIGAWTPYAVGIGTSVPDAKLHLVDGNVLLTNSNIVFNSINSGGSIVGCSSITSQLSYSNQFRTNDTGGGPVIINGSIVDAPLTFTRLVGDNSSVTVGSGIVCYNGGHLRVFDGAKVGIGTTTIPIADLEVKGTANITGIITASNLIHSSSRLTVGTGVSIGSGIVTATNGFSSGIGTAVQITTVGDKLIFTVVGVGSTSLTLF